MVRKRNRTSKTPSDLVLWRSLYDWFLLPVTTLRDAIRLIYFKDFFWNWNLFDGLFSSWKNRVLLCCFFFSHGKSYFVTYFESNDRLLRFMIKVEYIKIMEFQRKYIKFQEWMGYQFEKLFQYNSFIFLISYHQICSLFG